MNVINRLGIKRKTCWNIWVHEILGASIKKKENSFLLAAELLLDNKNVSVSQDWPVNTTKVKVVRHFHRHSFNVLFSK